MRGYGFYHSPRHDSVRHRDGGGLATVAVGAALGSAEVAYLLTGDRPVQNVARKAGGAAATSLGPGMSCRPLGADQRDVELQGDLVAHQHAAGLQGEIRGHAEVRAVDGGLSLEAGS